MTKRGRPKWVVGVPPPARREFDKKTLKSIQRFFKRQAEGRWDGKGDPKLKGASND